MAKAKADIRSLARSHTQAAVKVLVGIMGQAKAAPAARVAAATAILDRGWGKPQQHTTLASDTENPLIVLLKEIDGRSRAAPESD